MGRTKKEVHDGKQTLKQAKAAFKARGSTLVTDTEKRQLERGAILLQRAERIKEAETRRKELKKKAVQDTKTTKTCLLGTQRVNDKFGYQRSQFHLGAFLKPKAAVPAAAPLSDVQEESPEPWEDDGVDDDTLLDLAGESPVTTTKAQPPARAPPQQTPSKIRGHATDSLVSPSTTDEFGSFDDLFERSSQLTRDLSEPVPPATRSFDRIPSFTSADFDLSADDLEELDWSVDTLRNDISSPQASRQIRKNGNIRNWLDGKDTKKKEMVQDIDRRLMPPPSMIPKKCSPPSRIYPAAQTTAPPHGISIADLEGLAAEEIQLSQFEDW
ncbi:hypothetical protein E4T52_04347 [Aureobasidium sp. EXF-3400]|nr:hypothetical protein E4T51_14414 [Aureobasidium sp. EXF-12344]KAI4780765.1 hypothetical protein E4T52_04347 [Aureobasidium sp. EXF-3400]